MLRRRLLVLLFGIMILLPGGQTAVAAPVFVQQNAQRYFDVVYAHICIQNPSLGSAVAERLTRTMLDACYWNSVEPLLAAALFTQESGFNPGAVSSTGAYGIAQIMPATAGMLGIDSNNVYQNVEGGVRYLGQMLRLFSGAGEWQLSYAIAAYNAGPGAVQKYGGIPPYSETRYHVQAVDSIYRKLLQKMAAVKPGQ